MEGMVLSFHVGMARVEVGGFRDSCLVHPQTILQQLEYQLPHLANSKSDYIVGKIKVSTVITAHLQFICSVYMLYMIICSGALTEVEFIHSTFGISTTI